MGSPHDTTHEIPVLQVGYMVYCDVAKPNTVPVPVLFSRDRVQERVWLGLGVQGWFWCMWGGCWSCAVLLDAGHR